MQVSSRARALLLALTRVAFATALFTGVVAYAEESSRTMVVSEYITELVVFDNLRTDALRETKRPGYNPLTDGIAFSTRTQLEIRTHISTLQGVRLDPPLDELPGQLTHLMEQRIELHQSLIDVATKFLSGPQPGVDYGALTAEMPKNSRVARVSRSERIQNSAVGLRGFDRYEGGQTRAREPPHHQPRLATKAG